MQPTQPQQQQQPTPSLQQHQVLTPSLISDLLTLLRDPKPTVIHQTLNVLLQYTTLPQSKQKFSSTPLISLLTKHLFTPQLTTVCLSNMINLSSEQCFHDKFSTIIEPLILQMQQWKEKPLPLELSALLLINLSKIQQCVQIIVGKEDKEGYCLSILFEFLKIPKIGAYVTNISSNVTSFEVGRKLFAKSGTLIGLKEHLFSNERDKRMGVVKTIRNTLFEWEDEKFITTLLAPEHHFIDDLIVYQIYLLSTSTHIIKDNYNFEQILKHMQIELKHNKFTAASHYKEKEMEELVLVIELLLILTNVDFQKLKPVYQKEEFKELIAVMSRLELGEEEKDKLDALNVFFC